MPGNLSTYHAKRDFGITPEPKGEIAAPADRLRFVVQKHDARRLHYDFRLEFGGTLKSWAVPKGPSLDPSEKRLAVHVEDHPLDYIDFEGDIPAHQYGAGHVDVWDIGYWEPQGDPQAAYEAGKLKFKLEGEKLHGGWTLVRTHLRGNGDKEQWLLIKEHDDEARTHDEYDITETLPDSILSKPASAKKKTAKASTRKTARASKPGAAISDNNANANAHPNKLTGAKKSALPANMSPQLATLVDAAPTSGDWHYEIKFDGYRLLARIDNGTVTLFTRDGNDWTAKLPKQAAAVAALGLKKAWLDGEIVVLDAHGMPSFQLLQNAFDASSTAQIVYFVFDLPYVDGYDLRNTPLRERRELLQQIMARTDASNDVLRYSAPLDRPPQQLLDSACQMHMEGIIGKLSDSPYSGKRNANWIKLKCRRRQELVIVGYTEPQGSRKFFGALLLGVYDDAGNLHYAGRVGTGFDRKVLHATYQRMQPLKQTRPTVTDMPAGVRRAATHWIKPELVAEISFAEWTQDGLLRQAAFHGLRVDKEAKQVRREQAIDVRNVIKSDAAAPLQSDTIGDIKITHPDRVIDVSTGITKLQLAQYYQQVAPQLLPFLRNRPVYLLRCPEGIAGEQFFQKHSERLAIPGIQTLDPALDPEHGPLMVIASDHALAGASQMGMVELHTCNATADLIEKPDCMVFDLDPDPALPWKRVVEAAQLTKVVLDELGLKSFLKTSGGKGLHIVVPLARRHAWDVVTTFAQAVAQHMATTLPRHFSAKMGAKNRVGKIFIDYLRNQRKASTIAPYAARARPGLGVATPIAWEELADIDSAAQWNIVTLPQRLAQLKNDPWRDYAQTRQMITDAMRKTMGVGKK